MIQRRGNKLTAVGPVDTWIVAFTDSKGENKVRFVHRSDVTGGYFYTMERDPTVPLTVADDLIKQIEEKVGPTRTAERIQRLEEKVEELQVKLNRS